MEIPLYLYLFEKSISVDLKTVLLDIQKEHNNIHIEYVQPEHIASHKIGSIELVMEHYTNLEAMQQSQNI